MGRMAIADWNLKAESGLTGYLCQIQRFSMLEPQEEYMLAKRWREFSDHEAAHKLVNSHLRLVAKIARGYRGYGLPISDVISEGNVGLMQAVRRFKPEKGFRLATYAVWWIRAAIQEYILHSWSLVRMATTTNRRRLFFNLRKVKGKIALLDVGDIRHDQVETIAKRLGVTMRDVIDMNQWLSGDASLNAPMRDDGDSGEWQEWLVDDRASQETTLAANEEFDNFRHALVSALSVLNNRERRIFEARRLTEEPIRLADLASEFDISRERVRQIDVSSFEKVRKAVKNRIATMETLHLRETKPFGIRSKCVDSGAIIEGWMKMPQNIIQRKSQKLKTTISDEAERKRREKALDEAIENTFPASDPVSAEQPVQAHGRENRPAAVASYNSAAE